MLKAGNLASREDHRVRGVKSGRTRSDGGISHVRACLLHTGHKKYNIYLESTPGLGLPFAHRSQEVHHLFTESVILGQ